MSKLDLGDICGHFLSSRLTKQNEFKNHFNNQHIANEHKSHSILTQKLLFKPYKKNPLDQLRKRYTNVNSFSIENEHITQKDDITNHTNKCSELNNKSSLSAISTSSTSSSSSSLMMKWELLNGRGLGLVNLGNTCFINASLQCLANTPPLVQWILSNSHNKYCRMKLENKICLFCEAERVVKLIHSKNSHSSFAANPNNIVRRIKDISKTFRFGRQEDASEFLICLIDKIIESCLRSSQPPERLRPSSGSSYDQLCHSQTFLHDLFALVLRSRVICSRCRYTSDTFEVQYTWIVSIRNQSDLRQSLQQFVCRENLSGENLYRCMKCKQLVPAVKRYTLHKASKILLINFKRFEYGKNSHKLSHLVRYPEHLNVKPYMSEENSNNKLLNYRLYAVLVHMGSSMHSGHYYSYVRSPNNRWYKADDSSMTQCDLNQVLAQHGAYILCYIQEADAPSTENTIQNGKTHEVENFRTTVTTNSKFFTPKQINSMNHPRQINGLNGHLNSHVTSTNKESINGNRTVINGSCNIQTSCLPNKLNETENKSLSSTTSMTNGHTHNLSTFNHKKNNRSSNDLSDSDEPLKKKQRIENFSSISLINNKKKSHENYQPYKLQLNNQNGSNSPITSSSTTFVNGDQYRKLKINQQEAAPFLSFRKSL